MKIWKRNQTVFFVKYQTNKRGLVLFPNNAPALWEEDDFDRLMRMFKRNNDQMEYLLNDGRAMEYGLKSEIELLWTGEFPIFAL